MELNIDELMKLDNKELIEVAASQQVLTPLELELMLRLEQFVAAYGDYLKEPVH